MPIPSVFHHPDVRVAAVPAWSLVPSPRNYNASLLDFDGRRLMAYRSHRMAEGGRCGIVLCELGAAQGADGRSSWHAKPKSNHWLELAAAPAHCEDPRLFVFRGRLHVAYTETKINPDQTYTCVMKYARLRDHEGKGRGSKRQGWQVERVFWPRHGRNDGAHQEKNWQFFEAQKGRLHVIYQAEPHTVLELGSDGETVLNVTTAPRDTVRWPWGTIRGGTPPQRMADGRWLTIFHSSTPYPVPPHWRRYYAGAYVFEPEAPYRITAISQRPILTGSEEDGHAYDPRNIDSWKPFVVFPSGLAPNPKGGWLVSYGINDHLTAIAEHTELHLGDPKFAGWGPKYFRTENGHTPIRLHVIEDRPPQFIPWQPVRGGGRAGVSPGVLRVDDPRLALHLVETAAAVEEITEEQFHAQRQQ